MICPLGNLVKRVESSSGKKIIFLPPARIILDADFVSIVDRHNRIAGFKGNADKHSGIVCLVFRPVHHPNHAIAELLSRPPQQSHTSVGFDQAILDGHVSGTYMLPTSQVLAIEELPPPRLRSQGQGQEKSDQQT